MKTSSERESFSTRLQQSLQNANLPSNQPTQLAREFNFRFSGRPITVHAARKWLVGEAIPTQDKLRTLAQWLGVTAEWLRFGGAEMHSSANVLRSSSSPDSAETKLIKDFLLLDEYDRQIVQDFIRLLAQKHRGSVAGSKK
jgi:hypothetical protein